MSDRAGEERPSDIPRSGGNDNAHSERLNSDFQDARPPFQGASDTSSAISRTTPASGNPVNLPSLLPARSGSVENCSPLSRPAGFSAILNPAESDEWTQASRYRTSQLGSPRSASLTLPPLGTSAQSTPALAASSIPLSAPAQMPGNERAPRRILTPKSPSLHRAASLTQLNPPTGTISASQTPFPTSPRTRSYAIEPGTSGVPPLPTPRAAARLSYGFPGSLMGAPGTRRTSQSTGRSVRIASASASPRSSYSSYSQARQASPPAQFAPPPMQVSSDTYTTGPEASVSTPSTLGSDRQRALGVPISSTSGPSVYQMMTLETTSGTVQVPVDVQAASRVADEKRRRNAGASARFRQRRKEKEKESTTTISRLEQQIKELSEDMEFYKRERDYFKGVVLQVPGGERHFPRPPSPPRRRTSSLVSGPIGPSNSGYVHISDQGSRGADEGRNVRRRTSASLPLPPPPQPQQQHQLPPSMVGSQLPPGYFYPQPLAPQPLSQQQQPSHAPPSHPSAGAVPSPMERGVLPRPAPGPPQLMQAVPQTGPWNPYANERRAPGPNHGRDTK